MPVKNEIPLNVPDTITTGQPYIPGSIFHGEKVRILRRSQEHIHAYKCQTLKGGFSLTLTRSQLLFVKHENTL